jgi:tetratricopeptide (TPR) repeat protein
MPTLACVTLIGVFAAAACGPAEAPADLVSQARQLDLDGQQDAAIVLYQEALESDPDAYDAHYGLARALDLAGRYDEARAHFARALELSPEPSRDQTLRMMGIAWTFVGDREQAASYFREVFDRRLGAGNVPGASEVANELGRVYLELGDLEMADEWYRRGHEVAGQEAGRPDWQVRLADMRWAHAQARIAARRGRAEQARQHEAEVAALLEQGGNDDQREQDAYLRGYVAYHLNDHASALAHLREADQEDPFILLLQAQAREALGDLEGAQAHYGLVLASNSHAVNNAFARPIARQKLAAAQVPVAPDVP